MAMTTVNIEIFATAELLSLVRRASAMSQITTEEFMLEASVVAAYDALGGQASLAISAAQMAEFERLMNRPFAENDAIRKLLASRSPWER